jgi:hypothetical protein
MSKLFRFPFFLPIGVILVAFLTQCGGNSSESQMIDAIRNSDPSVAMTAEFSTVKLTLEYYQMGVLGYYARSLSRNMYDLATGKIANPVDVLLPGSLDEARKYVPVQLEVAFEPVLPFIENGLDSLWSVCISETRYDNIDTYRWSIKARSTSKSVFGRGVILELNYQKIDNREFEFVYAWSLTREQQREIVKNSPNGASDVIFK